MAVTFVDAADGTVLRVSVQFPFEPTIAFVAVVPSERETTPPGIPVPLTTRELLLILVVVIVGAVTVNFKSTVPEAPG